ncbi:GNAT family N-acetyltransferase [Pseudonocardia humida]|uniref:GNAT family N-acetyltransferase n=1 Tax=Pseudonocardia humida TaxID=2800819 RepID=A0ABT1A1R3_9PSEU|nr:GNAT family N-acetyltransferase [Pseudonocardia humida]MCO1656932.1 GNAT family N-acetyltransferase [Pseudonocardia humida]
MNVSVVEDVAEFATAVEPVLATDPTRHTITITALDAIRRGGAPVDLMLLARDAGEVVGAALRSPGRHLLVEALPARFAEAAADVVARVHPGIRGVTGPVPAAEEFARALAARSGATYEVSDRNRLFELGELVSPASVPGSARLAGEEDVDLLAHWRDEFAVEAHEAGQVPVDSAAEVRRNLRLGCAEVVWEVDGVVVSQATARPVLAGMSRIGPVYTPPEHRRHGYAAAVTAAASRWALDAGAARVLLFTDLSNPTTNALYPRIGYRPVHDRVDLVLVPD